MEQELNTPQCFKNQYDKHLQKIIKRRALRLGRLIERLESFSSTEERVQAVEILSELQRVTASKEVL